MNDNSPIKLDKKDKLIMRELEENARASFNTIGKKIGLSGEVVEYRLRGLKRQGIISRMFSEADLQKLGVKTYRIYLKTENMDQNAVDKLQAYIASNPKVQWYAEFEGEWDYTIRYTMENEDQFKKEMDGLIAGFGRYIKAKDIVITNYQTYLPATYLTGCERKPRGFSLETETREQKTIDETDRKILFYLFDDARIKSTEIAAKLKISPDAVQYRIKKLIDQKIIAFFTTWFDRRKLGYEYYKVLLWFQYPTRENEQRLIAYCEQHPNIVFINRVIGNWDLEIDFDARNSKEIHEFIKGITMKFQDIIRDHTTLTILSDAVMNPFRKK
jgi:Lrp/AsnC family leucine-responsive transcriptional regulator